LCFSPPSATVEPSGAGLIGYTTPSRVHRPCGQPDTCYPSSSGMAAHVVRRGGSTEVVAVALGGSSLTRWNSHDGGRAGGVSRGCNPRPMIGTLRPASLRVAGRCAVRGLSLDTGARILKTSASRVGTPSRLVGLPAWEYPRRNCLSSGFPSLPLSPRTGRPWRDLERVPVGLATCPLSRPRRVHSLMLESDKA